MFHGDTEGAELGRDPVQIVGVVGPYSHIYQRRVGVATSRSCSPRRRGR
jgi:hypothetical protein